MVKSTSGERRFRFTDKQTLPEQARDISAGRFQRTERCVDTAALSPNYLNQKWILMHGPNVSSLIEFIYELCQRVVPKQLIEYPCEYLCHCVCVLPCVYICVCVFVC